MSRVSVVSLDPRFRRIERKILQWGERLLLETGENAVFDISLLGDRFMKKNVLAFPAPIHFPRPDRRGRFLGEICLNPSYIKAHGENLMLLVIHGFLHLLGYDHVRKSDRIKMEMRERALFRRLEKRN